MPPDRTVDMGFKVGLNVGVPIAVADAVNRAASQSADFAFFASKSPTRAVQILKQYASVHGLVTRDGNSLFTLS